jgi:hypothetical protein
MAVTEEQHTPNLPQSGRSLGGLTNNDFPGLQPLVELLAAVARNQARRRGRP